jgi:hypothetical protein
MKKIAFLLVLVAAPALADDSTIPRVTMIALMNNFRAKINVACACTVVNFSIGQWSAWPDTSTWLVTWPPGANVAAGQAAVAAFNPNDLANQAPP